jgi:hypothetical protein
LDIAGFLKLVIQALNVAGVEYLIGGAIAEWAWGEPRATQDLDLVVKIPIKAINKLSKELEKRDILLPADIILASILEGRADIPINAIHMHSGFKVDMYPVWEGDELRQSAFQRREQADKCSRLPLPRSSPAPSFQQADTRFGDRRTALVSAVARLVPLPNLPQFGDEPQISAP